MGLRRPARSLVLFLALSVLNVMPSAAADKEPPSLYVIERDTLQTRNYTPIVNHQTMVVNLGEAPVTLDLTSKFPVEKNRKGDGYPAFLDDSLIADPVFSPLEVTPRKTSYLARPEMTVDAKDVSYVWRKVTLPSGESVIAQYDNYFGEDGYYWRNYGFDFQGVRVKTDYRVQPQKSGRVELSLNIEITNETGEPVQDFALGVFVPVRQLLKEKESTLLELDRICTSPNVEASRITKSDGFGEAAEGVGANINVKELLAGKPESFFLCLSGVPAKTEATAWPIVSVTGRSIRPAIWPATIIRADTPVNEGRFSYLAYNLVVKDRQLFRFSPKGVRVETAK